MFFDSIKLDLIEKKLAQIYSKLSSLKKYELFNLFETSFNKYNFLPSIVLMYALGTDFVTFNFVINSLHSYILFT